MYRKSLFLFFCMIFAGSIAFCQIKVRSIIDTNALKKPIVRVPKKPTMEISPSMLVSPTFYCDNLGFFCKQEIKFAKVTKIPFVFRLGSVAQVDYLEGKRGVFIGNR
jgi:hypothetical protein